MTVFDTLFVTVSDTEIVTVFDAEIVTVFDTEIVTAFYRVWGCFPEETRTALHREIVFHWPVIYFGAKLGLFSAGHVVLFSAEISGLFCTEISGLFCTEILGLSLHESEQPQCSATRKHPIFPKKE